MLIIGYLLLICAVIYIATLGVAMLLVRDTLWERQVLNLPLVLGPTLLVCVLSGVGYLKPPVIRLAGIWGVLMVGFGITALVCITQNRRFRALTAHDFITALLIFAISFLAGCLIVVPHIYHGDFGYFEFMNGEFLNYSQIAAYSLGLQNSEIPVPWIDHQQSLRDGIDFFNMLIVALTREHPVHIVQTTSAVLRICFSCSVFSLVFWTLRRRHYGRLIALMICLAFAGFALDVWRFQVSFMAANLAIGSGILLFCILLASDRLGVFRFTVAYTVCSISLLVSYPEGMALLKIAEIVVVGDRLFRCRDIRFAKIWLMGNVMTCAVNPVLVFNKVVVALRQAMSGCGWDILGNPLVVPEVYLRRLFGLQFPYLPETVTIPENISVYVAAVFAIFSLIGFYYLSRRVRTVAVFFYPFAIVTFHVIAYADENINFYGAVKVVLLGLWLVPVGMAAMVSDARVSLRVTVLAVLVLWNGTNIATVCTAIATQVALPTFYSADRVKHIMAQLPQKTRPPAAIVAADAKIPLEYWQQVMDFYKFKLLFTNKFQIRTFSRGGVSSSAERLLVENPVLSTTPVLVIEPRVALWIKGKEVILKQLRAGQKGFRFSLPLFVSLDRHMPVFTSPEVNVHLTVIPNKCPLSTQRKTVLTEASVYQMESRLALTGAFPK